MIDICNLHYQEMQFEYDVKVDRTTVLGNPFKIYNDKDRNWACDRYAEYAIDMLSPRIRTDGMLRLSYQVTLEKVAEYAAEILRLRQLLLQYGKLRLFCWCAPKRCHAETIKLILEKTVKI